MGAVGAGGVDNVILVQWVCSSRCVFERQDLLWHGKFFDLRLFSWFTICREDGVLMWCVGV
jgi:hypothetical protein